MASPVLPRPIRFVATAVLDFALPPRCPGCGVVVGADHSFCLDCWGALDFLGGTACACCAEPLQLAFHDDAVCGACMADPPPFDRLRAAVAYGPIARALALKLKYGRRPAVAMTMAAPLRRAAGDLLDDALVVPVPLHRRRLWWRGYNQAAVIARAIAPKGSLAVDLLVRHRSTKLLRGLGRAARARMVAGAFRINPAWRDRVRGARVVLVDDVYTTGATVKACARVLRKAGAAHVAVVCWARVVRDDAQRVDSSAD
jgi:ComF family protein